MRAPAVTAGILFGVLVLVFGAWAVGQAMRKREPAGANPPAVRTGPASAQPPAPPTPPVPVQTPSVPEPQPFAGEHSRSAAEWRTGPKPDVLRGVLVDALGRPVTSGRVTVTPVFSTAEHWSRYDDVGVDGAFSVADLPDDGPYTVQAEQWATLGRAGDSIGNRELEADVDDASQELRLSLPKGLHTMFRLSSAGDGTPVGTTKVEVSLTKAPAGQSITGRSWSRITGGIREALYAFRASGACEADVTVSGCDVAHVAFVVRETEDTIVEVRLREAPKPPAGAPAAVPCDK